MPQKCASCGFPMIGKPVGTKVACPYCSSLNEAVHNPVGASISSVTVPSGLFWGLAGLVAGVIFGPSILASTESGSKWMAKKARERIQ